MVKKIGIGLLLVLIVAQFFQPTRTVEPTKAEFDFLTRHKPPVATANLIKLACYDCHSNETRYPWYANISPVSWWLNNHIVEGRKELNFSLWATYSTDKANHKLKECEEKIREKSMPLQSYTWTHSEARLSEDQRRELANYFLSLR